MSLLKSLFEQNREWSRRVQDGDPDFFQRLSDRQSPECLWIGCSDSRVPATQIVDGVPGDLFVHRNIANVVSQTDLNVQSVLQYAVDALEVKHVIVCDHYGCGGVLAVLQNKRSGPLRDWLEHVQGVQQDHRTFLETVPDDDDLGFVRAIHAAARLGRSAAPKLGADRSRPIMRHAERSDIRSANGPANGNDTDS